MFFDRLREESKESRETLLQEYAKEERLGDAWASGGEEGRGKRRNATGTGWHRLIRRYPNGATHQLEELVPLRRGQRGELKHLSTRRKRKQA